MLLSRLKDMLKLILAYSMYLTGILHLYKKLILRGKAVVIMYHRVLTSDEAERTYSHEAIIVNDKLFEKQLAFLKKHFNVIDAIEFVHTIQSGSSFENAACLITFDDGWIDNYLNAYPLLNKYGVSAVIFLSTDYIGYKGLFWQERVRRQLNKMYEIVEEDHGELKRFRETLAEVDLDYLLGLPKNRRKQEIERQISDMKALSADERNVLLNVLDSTRGRNTRDQTVDRFLDWEQVQEMTTDGIQFCPHGASHLILKGVSAVEVRAEVNSAREVIRSRLGVPTLMFSYPNGEFDDNAIDILKEQDVHYAFTANRGFIRKGSCILTLPRINIHDSNSKNMPMFLCTILGII